jgi:hypothetical protein
LANDESTATPFAITLTKCDDLAGLFAVGTTGTVKIGHHFCFDMKTPFQPESSDQLFMLTGRNTVDNPIAIEPETCLAIQPGTDSRYPTWTKLSEALDGSAVRSITMPRTGRKRDTGFRALMPIPAFLAAVLMDARTEDAATLCTVAVRAIRDFDTRAAGSPVEAFEDAIKERKDESDKESDAPASAQKYLGWVPQFLWAVAHKKVTGGQFELADSAPVERWCTFVRTQCFGSTSGLGSSTPGNSDATTTPPAQATDDLRLRAVVSGLEHLIQFVDER